MDIKELKDEKYHDAYSEEKLFDKILKFAKSAGIKLIYLAFDRVDNRARYFDLQCYFPALLH